VQRIINLIDLKKMLIIDEHFFHSYLLPFIASPQDKTNRLHNSYEVNMKQTQSILSLCIIKNRSIYVRD
jgi:hypothetical protein